MNSRDGLYFKFKRLLFDAKKVLLDDNGKELLTKDIDMIKIRELYMKISNISDILITMLYG